MAEQVKSPFALDVVVIGCGGAIGSHLVPLLARMSFVKRLVLVDRDVYEPSNLGSQNIEVSDVGRPKARVQAGRVRRINPAVDVDAHHCAVEDLPWGVLHEDAMLNCTDSRSSRISVNEIAYRLGISWIDAAIDAGGQLVRIRSYLPHRDSACLECRFTETDYNLVEQSYPCQGMPEIPATSAPAELGAVAASLLASEVRKFSSQEPEKSLLQGELLLDLKHHRQYITSFTQNPDCRFDHMRWKPECLDVDIDTGLDEFIERYRPSGKGAMQVAGQAFARRLVCPECGHQGRTHWHLAGRIGVQPCRHCRASRVATALDIFETLEIDRLSSAQRLRPLRSYGFQYGEIISLTNSSGTSTYYQLGG